MDDDVYLADDYIVEQIRQIKLWRNSEPSVLARGFSFLLKPASWLFNTIVPAKALEALLHGAEWVTARMMPSPEETAPNADPRPPHPDLKACDDEAVEIQNWAIAYAIGEGAAAGWVGFLSIPLDIPAIVMLSLRTIRRIGYCYGYTDDGDLERDFVLGVLGSAGANTMAEKAISLHTLTSVQRMVTTQTFKSMVEKSAETMIGKEAAIIAVRDLAKQVGINLTKRKLLAAVPAIGAVVGGSLNGWYLRDIGIAAQRAYQERWLRAAGILTD